MESNGTEPVEPIKRRDRTKTVSNWIRFIASVYVVIAFVNFLFDLDRVFAINKGMTGTPEPSYKWVDYLFMAALIFAVSFLPSLIAKAYSGLFGKLKGSVTVNDILQNNGAIFLLSSLVLSFSAIVCAYTIASFQRFDVINTSMERDISLRIDRMTGRVWKIHRTTIITVDEPVDNHATEEIPVPSPTFKYNYQDILDSIKVPTQPPQQEETDNQQVFQDWVSKNPWYENDLELREKADQMGQELINEGRTYEDMLDEVSREFSPERK